MHKSVFDNFQIFVVSGQGKHAALTGSVPFLIRLGYPENTKYPPDKNCVFCFSHKIVGKLAYLSVKMMPLNQKHKIVMGVANLGVSKLRISFKGIKL